MAEKPRTFSKGEFIGGVVAALAVGFFIGSMFMEMRMSAQAPMQAGMSVPGQMPGQPGQGGGQMPPKGADPHDHAAELARIAELEMGLAKKPSDQGGWIELGNLYFDTHQAKQSIRAYETALGLGKASPDVWTDLGIMQREDGQPQKALDAFKNALAINPRHENALYNMGVVQLHDTGDKAGAAATWAKLIEVNPNAKTPDGRPLSCIVAELKK